jgi:transposase
LGERRKFTKEFKLAAIGPVLSGVKSVGQQAEDLGIGRTSLQRWMAEYRKEGGDAFPGSGNQAGLEAENSELRRRLKEAEMERDILKKAISIFGKDRP